MHTDTHDTPRDDTMHNTPPFYPDEDAYTDIADQDAYDNHSDSDNYGDYYGDYHEDNEGDDEPHPNANRAIRLLLLVLVLAMIVLFVLFVGVPFAQSLINPTTPGLPPAIQT